MKAWNSLWVRLTIAFTLVTLVTAGAIGVLNHWMTSVEFRQFVTRSEGGVPGGLVEQLGRYYRQRGSWEGVGVLLREYVAPRNLSSGATQSQEASRRSLVALLDAREQVVFVPMGKMPMLRPDDYWGARWRTSRLPISDPGSGQVVGYLLVALPTPDLLGPLAQGFLGRMRSLAIFGVAVAVGLGLAASALLSRNLTAPLSRLASAARAVAAGDLSQRVPVEGSAEIAEVARDFNEMTQALQKAAELRQNLVADVAHELRTPLSVLQGNLRAILDDVYPLEKAEVARLYDEMRLLSRLVDDLRDLAQAEAGQLGLYLRDTDIGDLLESTVANFGPAAESEGVALALEVADDLPVIQADPDRLAQVLRNLLTNALRHTPEGGQVRVTASRVREDKGEAIEIAVADTGEGIPPEVLPHIFERFWRADRSRSRETGGSGLGLSIARSLVEAHGGRIWAESVPGQGARFVFRLPVT